MTSSTRNMSRLALPRLKWLLDAPLFVDDALVERLFDAVVRPEYELQSRVVGELTEAAHKRLTGVSAGAEAKFHLPFLGGAKATADANLERESATKAGRTSQIEEHRVHTTGRRLEEIAIVYLDSHPDRIVFMDSGGKATTFEGKELSFEALEKGVSDSPRLLVFLELAPDSKILPMACELQTGESNLLYQKFIERLWHDGEAGPRLPAPDLKGDEQRTAWRAYWGALADGFKSTVAMEVVEQAAQVDKDGQGRIGSIDFRVPITREYDAMRLHLVPDGKYHTATFAYNFVRRANNVGVRIVGTLRAGFGTDMNVLAIFDT